MEMSSEERFLAYALFFKALSNRTRMAIVDLLRKGDRTVQEIVDELGFEQSRVSHNLRCLTFCGFVKNRKEGRNRVYSLNRETIEPLLELVDRHIGLYANHLYTCKVLRR